MSPEEQISALSSLVNHPGWALIREKFTKDRDTLREASMTQPDDVLANKMRHAWVALGEFDPEKQRDVLAKIAKREAAKGVPPASTDGAGRI